MPRMHQTYRVPRLSEGGYKYIGKAKTDSVNVWSYGVDIFEQFGEVYFLQLSVNVKLWATFVDPSGTIQTVLQQKASRKLYRQCVRRVSNTSE